MYQKHCVWLPEHEKQISKNFEDKARARLTGLLASARKKNIRPTWIEEPWWDELWVYWKSEEFLRKSAQATAARASTTGGSIHTGGARSMVDWKTYLETKNERPYTQIDVFKYTHRRRAKEGESEEDMPWVCPRSETSNLRYTEMLAELPAEVSEKMTPEEHEQMWLSAVGGVRGGHVYGMAGSSQNFTHRIESGLRGIGTSAGAEALTREGLEAIQEQVTRLTQSLESAHAEKEEMKRAYDTKIEKQSTLIQNQNTKLDRLESQMSMILGRCDFGTLKQPLPQFTWENECEDEEDGQT